MKTQMGIWIDTKKAIIVKLNGKESEFEVLQSGIETRERFEGEGKAFGRFGDQYLNDEKTKNERFGENVIAVAYFVQCRLQIQIISDTHLQWPNCQ